MYLKMIFPKNHEQTTMHLQFKFYPFPAESAGICHFQKRCMETFSQPTLWLFVNLTWSSVLKKCMSQFLQHICGCCFTKKPIFRTQKMENGFLYLYLYYLKRTNVFCRLLRQPFFLDLFALPPNHIIHLMPRYRFL